MSTRGGPARRNDLIDALEAAYARQVTENRAAVKALPLPEFVTQLDDLAQRPDEFAPAFRQALVERAAEMIREEWL